jgi:hypothetical protein
MATEIPNGKQSVKLYHSVNRGKAMYQLSYYAGGRRVQKNFADKCGSSEPTHTITDEEPERAAKLCSNESRLSRKRPLSPD